MFYKIALYEICDYLGIKGLFRVTPGESRIIKFTGPSGAGKTSLLHGIKFLIDGLSAIPGIAAHRKPVHKGADRSSGLLELVAKDGSKAEAHYTLKRGITDPPRRGSMQDGQAILIDNLGKEMKEPQNFLDALFTRFSDDTRDKRKKLAFDPQEFVGLNSDNQVNLMLQLAGVDPGKSQELDLADEKTRRDINAEIRVLEGRKVELAQTSYEGLPDKPIDIAPMQKKKDQAGAENQRQEQIGRKKSDLGAEASRIGMDRARNQQTIATQKEKIAELERQLQIAKDGLVAAQEQDKRLAKEHAEAEKAFQDAPEAQMVNVAALELEISRAQTTNQAIERRARLEDLKKELKQKQDAADKLTDGIAGRKRDAEKLIDDAKLPVEGLKLKRVAVGESGQIKRAVYFNDLPMANLSEGEQICVAAEILMVAEPKLHVLFIARGESLDEKGHQKLLDLCVKYDFQIFMAVLDSSPTEGYELYEGTLKIDHYAEPKQPVTIDAEKPKKGTRKK